jgi:Ser/Thr protein kinase RdoA (MazF antagonist)
LADEETNPAAILRSLGMHPTSSPERITGGMDTAIWRFTTADGEAHALRLFRPGQQPQADREKLAMDWARDSGLPVPAIEVFSEWQGRPVAIQQWVPGMPMLKLVEKKPWLVVSLGRRLGEAQAGLHRHQPPAGLLQDAPNYWLRRAGPEHEKLVDALMAQEVRTDTFVHMDFHPLNVLCDSKRITGIIDWVGAAAGDSRADFAFTMSILSVAPIPPGPLRPLFRVARRILVSGWRGGYESVDGKIDNTELAPFLAWAGGVMLHEMEPRAREGRAWPAMADLEPIRRWRDSWLERAGIAQAI